MPIHQNTPAIEITEELRTTIRRRASSATNRREVVRLLFEALAESGIDFRQVGLEQYKGLLLDAMRAARKAKASRESCCACT